MFELATEISLAPSSNPLWRRDSPGGREPGPVRKVYLATLIQQG
jgi:hypothetical protein